MIKYYQWQRPEGSTFYYFVVKPTRERDGGRKQYLGWFYKSKIDELYFDTRLNHSAKPDLLEDSEPNISIWDLRRMIQQIFTYDPGDV